ncbi:MAG TPA: hypothetical protein VJR23_03280 [Candidatus Acidoferrales bacterium]|nr:hypothetical protein [Candidatus Acidoferrales bacterium]
MTHSPSRIEVSLHNDSRLLAALSAIVLHSARRAGLPPAAQNDFACAAIDACLDTFPLIPAAAGNSGMLRVVLQDFNDRVEMTIEHSGEPLPTAGLDTFCAQAGNESESKLSSALQVKKVDRVQYETRDGVSRVILIKYSGARPRESSSTA